MSAGWARAALRLYRFGGSVVYPFIGGYVRWRARRGKEDYHRRRERYGHASAQRPGGPIIWVNAASVSATNAVTPLIEHFRALDLNVVLTTGTVTSARFAEERLQGPNVIHQYVPLDMRQAVARFLDHWQPDLAVMVDSDIWPMTVLELAAKRIPQIVVNGRMSDRSFARWSRRIELSEALMENLAGVIAQSERDAERFRLLGARPVIASGNLRADATPLPVDQAELDRLLAQIGSRPAWTAASTDEEEAAIVGRVHRALKKTLNLVTVLVPRDPSRADAIEQELTALGLVVARRSRGDAITEATHIYLGDMIGEMGLYLRLSKVSFVGNSLLSPGGGGDPMEPVNVGTALISGENVDNHRETFGTLSRFKAVRFVQDPKTLAATVGLLLTQTARRDAMIEAGYACAKEMRGALARTVTALDPHIQPLLIKRQLRQSGAVRRNP